MLSLQLVAVVGVRFMDCQVVEKSAPYMLREAEEGWTGYQLHVLAKYDGREGSK